jgi:hypothetical protein
MDAIGGGIGEPVGEILRAVVNVGERTVGGERQGAVRWWGGHGGRERISVGVGVVHQNAGRTQRQSPALGDTVAVPIGDRNVVVDGRDGEATASAKGGHQAV